MTTRTREELDEEGRNIARTLDSVCSWLNCTRNAEHFLLTILYDVHILAFEIAISRLDDSVWSYLFGLSFCSAGDEFLSTQY